MASSSTVSAGDTATATQYNNLRTDALTRTVWGQFAVSSTGYSYTNGNKSFLTAKCNTDAGYEEVLTSLCIPADFGSISSAVVVVIPDANTNTSWDVDIVVHYATADEAYTTHSDSDTSTTYDWSTDDNKIKEIDISGLLGSLAAGDYLGVEVDNNESDILRCLGVKIEYTV